LSQPVIKLSYQNDYTRRIYHRQKPYGNNIRKNGWYQQMSERIFYRSRVVIPNHQTIEYTEMNRQFRNNGILIILTVLIILGMLVFNVFHYSLSYGIIEINNINSLFLVPFILLVCWLGILLGSTKKDVEFELAFQNQISEREKDVIERIAQGKKNQEIADELFVDISTIKTHINNIYRKTGVKNRRELTDLARKVEEKVENE
jgi:DNA-binding CsgD family transcriptional regulator